MPCVGLLPEDVEPLLQPYPFEGYFKSKFRSSGGGILSPEEQDDCLDIIRFLKKEEKPHPAFPFSCTENKRKKPPSLPSLQLAGCWTAGFQGEGERKDEPSAAENVFLAEQLVEDVLAAGGVSPTQRRRCHLRGLGTWLWSSQGQVGPSGGTLNGEKGRGSRGTSLLPSTEAPF